MDPISSTAITFKNRFTDEKVNFVLRSSVEGVAAVEASVEAGLEIAVEPPVGLDGGVWGTGQDNSAFDLPLDLAPGDTKEFYPAIR